MAFHQIIQGVCCAVCLNQHTITGQTLYLRVKLSGLFGKLETCLTSFNKMRNQACIIIMVALTAIEHQHSNLQLTESRIWPWFCNSWCNDKNYWMNHQFHSTVCCIRQCWEILGRLSYLEMFNVSKVAKLANILLLHYTMISRFSCHATLLMYATVLIAKLRPSNSFAFSGMYTMTCHYCAQHQMAEWSCLILINR
jgi:hypothetical protein